MFTGNLKAGFRNDKNLSIDIMLSELTLQTLKYPDMMDSERQVAKFLDELGLQWIFEFPVFVYDERKRPRVWSPDFYIPRLGIYIEVCGSREFSYKYREKVYRDNNIPVIYIHFYKQQEKWRIFLIRRIKEIEEQRHSEAQKLVEGLTYSPRVS